MSSTVHIDKKNRDILIIGKGPTQGLDDTTKYSMNFSRSNKKFCLSLHYNGSNSFLFANVRKKIYQLKAKYSKIKKYPLFPENISGNLSVNSMKKQD